MPGVMSAPRAPRKSHAPLWIAKTLVTTGLLVWLARHVDLDQAVAGLQKLGYPVFALALATHALAFLGMTLRWWLLLRQELPNIPWRRVFPSYYLGVFFNLVLPSGFGGDAARTVHLGWAGLRLAPLINSLILDRAVGLLTILLMGCAAVWFAPPEAFGVAARQATTLTAIALLAGLGVYFTRWPAAVIARLGTRVRSKTMRALVDTLLACCAPGARPLQFLGIVAISLVAQLLVVAVYVLLGDALGIALAVESYLSVLPLVFLVSALPISIGGLGVRESALVTLLGTLGVASSQAAALSLAYLLVLWAASLPGAAVMLKRPASPGKNEISEHDRTNAPDSRTL